MVLSFNDAAFSTLTRCFREGDDPGKLLSDGAKGEIELVKNAHAVRLLIEAVIDDLY